MATYAILLTGAAGFIGSHLCESLLARGNHVTGLDNLEPFYDPAIKQQNLKAFGDHPNFKFIQGDLLRMQDLSFLTKNSFDVVIHLAAKAGVLPSIKDPDSYMQTNITGTHNLLEQMRKADIRKMLFASSSSVYGNAKPIPFKEGTTPTVPISPYAFTKLAGELLTDTYYDRHDFDILNLRLFTVYGPRQRPDLAIHKFSRLISEGKPIQMYGDGSSARDYTFIEDTLKGIHGALDFVMSRNDVYETFNLGMHTPMKLKDMISLLEEALGKKAVVEALPMQEGDVDITYADISKAREKLGYAPSTDITEGLRAFVSWFRNL